MEKTRSKIDNVKTRILFADSVLWIVLVLALILIGEISAIGLIVLGLGLILLVFTNFLILQKLTNNKKLGHNPAEESLNNSVFENSLDPILLVDTKGIITNINKAALEFSGLTKNQLVGHSFIKMRGIIAKESYNEITKHYSDVLKGKSVDTDWEVVLIDKHKKRHYFDVSSVEIRNNDQLMGFQVILRDVTEKRIQLEKLEKRTGELDSLNKIMIDREIEIEKIRRENEKLIKQRNKQ